MNAQRAQDILRHITSDEDYGKAMLEKLPLDEAIAVSEDLLNVCIKEADSTDRANDATFFTGIKEAYRPIIIDKIRKAEHLWIVYSGLTGYPYTVDGDMIVIYDYANSKPITDKLNSLGYMIELSVVDADVFAMEVAHMYRNGYKNIRFVSGSTTPFIVEREELYPYEQFVKDDYITNPALSQSVIALLQETRKEMSVEEGNAMEEFRKMLQKREADFLNAMKNAEFMIPCSKTESNDSIEISIEHIDITEKIGAKNGSRVLAIPAFTDGFEMNKCYPGLHENMLYTYSELADTVKELGAAGIIINALGASQFMSVEDME